MGGQAAVRKQAPRQPGATIASVRPSEVTAVHTRILRLALGAQESRAYWEHVDPSVPRAERAKEAFERRWFGAKSFERVRFLLATFMPRYDAFPSAFGVLRRWPSMDLVTRQIVCHWHLQLSDPMYRRFAGAFLRERGALRDPKLDRHAVLRWVKSEYPGKWAESTCVQFASKLLSAAFQTGIVSRRDPRSLTVPKVPDAALGYILYLLRETRFEGSLTDNPYLASVGLDCDALAQRTRALRGVTLRRMMGLVEFDWAYPDLATWAREVLW